PSSPTLFPYTTLFRSDGDAVLGDRGAAELLVDDDVAALRPQRGLHGRRHDVDAPEQRRPGVLVKFELLWHGSRSSCLLENGEDVVLAQDRKSTRLNSSHVKISYAVFC